jgi:hypothetical protein
MKSEKEILLRIETFQVNLAMVQQKMGKELEKHYKKRDKRLLLFLYKEKSVWEFAIEQLHWLMSDELTKKEIAYETV